jgi:hypothetical protein
MRIESNLINELKHHLGKKYNSLQYLDEGESVIKFKAFFKSIKVLIRVYSTNKKKYFGNRYNLEKLGLTCLKGVKSDHFVFPEIIEEMEIVNNGIRYDCLVLSWLSGSSLVGDIITPYFKELGDIMIKMGKELIKKNPNIGFYEKDVINHLLSLGLNSEMMDNHDGKGVAVITKLLMEYYYLIPKTVSYLKKIDRDTELVMIHGDLHRGNIVLNKDLAKPKFGIIDWEYASIGYLNSFDISYFNYSEFIRINQKELDTELLYKIMEENSPLEISLAAALNIHWGITELQRHLLRNKKLNPESIETIETQLEIYKIINDMIT